MYVGQWYTSMQFTRCFNGKKTIAWFRAKPSSNLLHEDANEM